MNYYILIWALDRFCFMLKPSSPRATSDAACHRFSVRALCAYTLQQRDDGDDDVKKRRRWSFQNWICNNVNYKFAALYTHTHTHTRPYNICLRSFDPMQGRRVQECTSVGVQRPQHRQGLLRRDDDAEDGVGNSSALQSRMYIIWYEFSKNTLCMYILYYMRTAKYYAFIYVYILCCCRRRHIAIASSFPPDPLRKIPIPSP